MNKWPLSFKALVLKTWSQSQGPQSEAEADPGPPAFCVPQFPSKVVRLFSETTRSTTSSGSGAPGQEQGKEPTWLPAWRGKKVKFNL